MHLANNFVHVGFSKCASTYLQTHLFPKHKDIMLYSKNLSGKGEKFPETSGELTRSLVNLETFSGLKAKHVNDLQKFIGSAQKNSKAFVWSNEHFCESVAPFFLKIDGLKVYPSISIPKFSSNSFSNKPSA